MYEDDSKIMDCELLANSPKKRLSMPAATKKYLETKKKLTKKMGSHMIKPEILEQEKKRIMARLHKTGSSAAQDLNTEQVYNLIKKRAARFNNENPDLGTRNYMLPSYHTKTHYKGAFSL